MYLGLDLGTSGLKALLCDAEQRTLATARIHYPMQMPSPGRCEQDPADWIAAAGRAIAELRKAVPAIETDLQAIGLSGQMHGLVALDAANRPLRPAILWNDTRGAGFVRRSGEALPRLAEITGVGAMTSFTAAKLDWLADCEPETFSALRRLVLPKDFVRLWLTGDWATDASDAAGTQLFDQAARQWSAEVAAALRLDPAVLPPVREGTEQAGTVRAAVAEELGLPRVPVISGGGDAATGALGAAVVDETRTLISLGTGAVVLVGARRYDPPENTSLHHFAHCLPARWYRMAALLNCGSALDWVCELTGVGRSAEALGRLDAQGWTALSQAMVLPYLDGVRTPHSDPDVRGAVLGLARSVDGLDLVQAMLEGILLLARGCRRRLARVRTGSRDTDRDRRRRAQRDADAHACHDPRPAAGCCGRGGGRLGLGRGPARDAGHGPWP